MIVESNIPKINYVIATWSGKRRDSSLDQNYYENVLKNHIKILKGTKNLISQVTVMKPECSVKNSYYDVDFPENTVIVETENMYQSYGQWMIAAQKYIKDFDYFIFIEDDYVPGCHYFDKKLLSIYQEYTYLCSSVSSYDHPDWNVTFKSHAEISNGIISKKSLKKVLSTDYKTYYENFHACNPRYTFKGRNFQLAFSMLLLDSGISLKDYRKTYPVDFHRHDDVYDYSKEPEKTEMIFTAIQSKI